MKSDIMKQQKQGLKQKLGLKQLFFISTILLYIVIAVINKTIALKATKRFLTTFIKLVPVFIGVVLLLAIINSYISKKKLQRFFTRRGFIVYPVSIIAGWISSGPIYAWYPLLAGLSDEGLKPSAIALFLYNRAIKIPLIPIMIYYFGLKLAILISILIIIGSIPSAFIVEKLVIRNHYKKPKAF